MPWPWQQSKWRPVIAQAAMWVVLCATVGVAALIDQRSGGSIELAEPVTYGNIQVAFPKGWGIKRSSAWRTLLPEVVLTAQPRGDEGESADVRPARSIIVTQQRVGASTSPEQYLRFRREVPPGTFPKLNMAGQTGVKAATRSVIVLDGEPFPTFDLWGCVVLPSGLAITVDVQGLGQPGASDQRLFTAVADSVRAISQ